MKILSKSLGLLVGLAFFATVITLVLQIFYFFDIFLLKLTLAEAFIGIVSLYSKESIDLMILKKKIEENEKKLTDRLISRLDEEDEQAITTLLKYNLEKAGYEVKTVNNGNDGMDTFLRTYLRDDDA